MRYYIYLDKPFLRTLFAVLDESNFNIDVFEYAVRRSYTNNKELSLDPSLENGKSCEIFKDNDKDKKRAKNSNFNNERLRVGFEKEVSCNVQTEKKYINISDIVDMKNIGFYHKLIVNIENINKDRSDNRLYIDEGYITVYDKDNSRENENKFDSKDGFFRIDNTCIWYDKEKLQGDINLLSCMSCKIKVVGYLVSCIESSNKVVKALAIFIE